MHGPGYFGGAVETLPEHVDVSPKQWSYLQELEKASPALATICRHVESHSAAWRAWSMADEPHRQPLPMGFAESSLTDFQLLLLINGLCHEKVATTLVCGTLHRVCYLSRLFVRSMNNDFHSHAAWEPFFRCTLDQRADDSDGLSETSSWIGGRRCLL